MKHLLVLGFLIVSFGYPVSVAALVKTNNASISGSLAGWTAANGTGTGACNNDNSGSESNFSSFAYSGSLSGQTALRTSGSATLGTNNYRGMAHQQLAIPGSGPVNVQGSFSYYGAETSLLGLSGGSNSSWIRLDAYNSANNTFVANLGCVAFTEDVNWAGSAPVNAVLSGGTTYTVRATLRSTITGLIVTRTVVLGIDNINVNVAPVNLSATQPNTSVNLAWAVSTPGTGAPALHASQGYEIARKTSSGVTAGDIIATASTNSYVDAGLVGNTTYWYAVFDKDTTGARSPMSAVVSLLTKPGLPQDVTVSAPDESSLAVSWQAPAGGAASYTVARAPDNSGVPGTFTNVATGVTGTSYTDSGHVCGATYWYRITAVNASGTSSSTNPVKGSTLYCISITLDTDGHIDFGLMPLESTRDTSPGGINDPEIIKAEYGAVDLAVRSTVFTNSLSTWDFGGTPGPDRAKLEFSTNGVNWTTFLLSGYYYTLKDNVATSSPASLFLRLTTPTDSGSLGPYQATITVQATRP